MTLTIVMPAYNESGCIEAVVNAWVPILDKIPGKMIVVNDGSRDNTGPLLDGLALKHPNLVPVHQDNQGHGAAVMNGYREALRLGSDFVFQTDSDDQFTAADFWKLWEKRDQSPFVTGYRQERSDAFHRRVITKIVVALNFIFFGVHLRDANVPFRLIRGGFLKELLDLFPGTVFAPNIFLTVLARKSGADLFEIPVGHQERKTGQVSIIKWKLLKICFRCVRELLAFRLRLLTQSGKIKALRTAYVQG